MTGAEYIIKFLSAVGCEKAFVVTGGACAFILDAIERGDRGRFDYVCFQHEQGAAMAADSVWRLTGKLGVTIATSGPGATNLITGIACSYFDSIPAIHITGQVNASESAATLGAEVRQAGFQETDIVSIVRPITKYAVQVNSGAELRAELKKAYEIATAPRMGPVVIDVPMNVQKEEVGEGLDLPAAFQPKALAATLNEHRERIRNFLKSAQRPLVLFGAGVGLAGAQDYMAKWLSEGELPFVASWNALTFFDHSTPQYVGAIGVYGNRGANFILQNCDALLVLGSRLDTRQRSSNPKAFAPDAKILAIEVDAEELAKYPDRYETIHCDLAYLPSLLGSEEQIGLNAEWSVYVRTTKSRYFGKRLANEVELAGLSPYGVVQHFNKLMREDAVVVADCGANLCWVYQVFHRTQQSLYTAGGNSPMGYSVPAAIGAALTQPERQIICFIGDGGMQMNIQELQTIRHYGLPIKIVILNNREYGIIKQFQDSYFGSRYAASGRGYSVPDFGAIAGAYGLKYRKVEKLEDVDVADLESNEAVIIDVMLPTGTLIQPKIEMGRPINDQFPYVTDAEFDENSPYYNSRRAVVAKP
ncbi:MAG: thiamine pyrophosphate-binding protein [Planctomycetes bacterium]|nr:thiamine pyrophosphate-binding protein [Planctomycetota bacterium]